MLDRFCKKIAVKSFMIFAYDEFHARIFFTGTTKTITYFFIKSEELHYEAKLSIGLAHNFVSVCSWIPERSI